jgi:hypothetical protein
MRGDLLSYEPISDPPQVPVEDLYDSENPLVPGRACGSCMLCCKVMQVPELSKPQGAMCSHAVAGKGCTIREHRPRSCRHFFCGWRINPSIDAMWKPDVCGFVITLSFHYEAMVLMVDPERPFAWKMPPYHDRLRRWAAGAFKENKRVVAMMAGGESTIILPDRDIPLGVLAFDDEIVISYSDAGYNAEVRKRPAAAR